MNILFFGTPSFAVPTLKSIHHSNNQIVGVITQPDRPAGRSRKMKQSPVKELSTEYDLPVTQTADLRDPEFLRLLTNLDPDLGVVVAFSILPPEVYQIPKLGCINLHASLLPDLRGAAPINHALFRGYDRTGLTTFKIEKRVDTGHVLLQKSLSIDPHENAGELTSRMSIIGAELVLQTINGIAAGTLHEKPQSGKPTKAPKLTAEMRRIDWNRKSLDIHNLVRGMSPVPCAYSSFGAKILKLYRTEYLEIESDEQPGTIVDILDSGIIVAAGRGCLSILELQLEGRKKMSFKEFSRGSAIAKGTRLGN